MLICHARRQGEHNLKAGKQSGLFPTGGSSRSSYSHSRRQVQSAFAYKRNILKIYQYFNQESKIYIQNFYFYIFFRLC